MYVRREMDKFNVICEEQRKFFSETLLTIVTYHSAIGVLIIYCVITNELTV